MLTACRGLYTVREGEQASKIAAARWAAGRYPDWSEVIRDALEWRQRSRAERERAEGAGALRGEIEFVRFAVAELDSPGVSAGA